MALFGLGCAAGGARGPVAPSNESAVAPGEAAAEPAPASTMATDSAGAPGATVDADFVLAAKAETPLGALCLRMCERMAETCSEESVDACRFNCTRFEGVPEICQAPARDALECALEAEDLLCIEVAPASCVEPFKQYQDCTTNPAGYQPAGLTSSGTRVNAWPLVEDRERGFKVRFPTSAELVTVEARPVWKARWDGTEWVATVIDVTGGGTGGQRLMKAARAVATECPAGVRLHGQYETPGGVHVSFNAICDDGKSWRGALHLFGERAFVTAVRGEVSKDQAQHFFDSFERL